MFFYPYLKTNTWWDYRQETYICHRIFSCCQEVPILVPAVIWNHPSEPKRCFCCCFLLLCFWWNVWNTTRVVGKVYNKPKDPTVVLSTSTTECKETWTLFMRNKQEHRGTTCTAGPRFCCASAQATVVWSLWLQPTDLTSWTMPCYVLDRQQCFWKWL